MQKFEYTVKCENGIHARPSALLAMHANKYKDLEITVVKDGKTALACSALRIMTLNIQKGDTISVQVTGKGENQAIESTKMFFENNF